MTDDGPPTEQGPDRIRSIAVHREDVATALEATLRSDREVVLRVTPPFSGRMRARLHSTGVDSDSDPAAKHVTSDETRSAPDGSPLHIDPKALVTDAPPYPEVDETAADHPGTDVDTRRKRHTEAVESWREAVRRSVVDTVAIDIGDGEGIDVDVTVLG